MRKTFLLLALSLCFTGASTGVAADKPAGPAPAPPTSSVNASDLGRSVAVIGPLGKPLGQVMTIEGRLVLDSELKTYREAKLTQNLFRVEKVDGRKLESPVKIDVWAGDKKISGTETVTLSGAQNGGFVNGPGETPLQNDGWHFQVHFTVVNDSDAFKP